MADTLVASVGSEALGGAVTKKVTVGDVAKVKAEVLKRINQHICLKVFVSSIKSSINLAWLNCAPNLSQRVFKRQKRAKCAN